MALGVCQGDQSEIEGGKFYFISNKGHFFSLDTVTVLQQRDSDLGQVFSARQVGLATNPAASAFGHCSARCDRVEHTFFFF